MSWPVYSLHVSCLTAHNICPGQFTHYISPGLPSLLTTCVLVSLLTTCVFVSGGYFPKVRACGTLITTTEVFNLYSAKLLDPSPGLSLTWPYLIAGSFDFKQVGTV